MSKNKLVIIYKLLNDLLLLALVFFAIALVADGMIPGIVTDHISFLKMTLLIAFLLLAIYSAGVFSEVNIEKRNINKKTAILLGFFAAILVFNSLFKLNITLAIFILFFTLIAGYFVYKNIWEENK